MAIEPRLGARVEVGARVELATAANERDHEDAARPLGNEEPSNLGECGAGPGAVDGDESGTAVASSSSLDGDPRRPTAMTTRSTRSPVFSNAARTVGAGVLGSLRRRREPTRLSSLLILRLVSRPHSDSVALRPARTTVRVRAAQRAFVIDRAMSELPPSTTTFWGCPKAFSMATGRPVRDVERDRS